MKLEVGKSYITECGYRAEITIRQSKMTPKGQVDTYGGYTVHKGSMDQMIVSHLSWYEDGRLASVSYHPICSIVGEWDDRAKKIAATLGVLHDVTFRPSEEYQLNGSYHKDASYPGKRACTCGAQAIRSNMHYDWCDGK